MAERAIAAGATPTVPPTDIPGVGRFAEIEDAEGAALRLWRARPDPTVPPAPGRVWWNQLIARDPPAARDFYASAIGWTPTDLGDTEAGPYTVFMAGDTEYQPPTDAPGVGTLSVIGDPGGATFLLITPEQRQG